MSRGDVPEGDVVLPAPDVWAAVRFAPVPDQVPDELCAFAIRQGDDWVLTDDVLAFGEVGTVQRFQKWRATWERVWTIDPVPDLLRLIALARELIPGRADRSAEYQWYDGLSDDGVVEIPVDEAASFVVRLAYLGDRIRERDATGHGIVDVTPGSGRVGLARSWSSFGEVETVAAASDVSIELVPPTGLHIVASAESDERFGPIERAEREGTGWRVWSHDRELVLEGDRGRPLAWLVPGAAEWVVRTVPEIVTWARTFGGLAEALEFSAAIGAPVQLSPRRPIADHGSGCDET